MLDPMNMIEGQLVEGLGVAKDLTRIDWVRRRLLEVGGIDPYPGTLNLALKDANLERWQSWCRTPGELIEPEGSYCRAFCYPVRIEGKVPAVALRPDTPDYPEDKMELVAALPLRRHLSLAENARVKVERCLPLSAEAILFDLDGTLIDSVGAYVEMARVAAAPYGFDVTEQHVRRCLATGNNFWTGIVPPGTPDCDLLAREMGRHAVRVWPGILSEFCTVFEGVPQTLDALRRQGIRLGVVSGARRDVLELLRGAGILDYFDSVVLYGDYAKPKPDPEGLTKGLEELGVDPGLAIYVGDAPIDVQASHAAGMRCVGVLTGAADSAQLSAWGPERLLPSHGRLPAVVCRSAADGDHENG